MSLQTIDDFLHLVLWQQAQMDRIELRIRRFPINVRSVQIFCRRLENEANRVHALAIAAVGTSVLPTLSKRWLDRLDHLHRLQVRVIQDWQDEAEQRGPVNWDTVNDTRVLVAELRRELQALGLHASGPVKTPASETVTPESTSTALALAQVSASAASHQTDAFTPLDGPPQGCPIATASAPVKTPAPETVTPKSMSDAQALPGNKTSLSGSGSTGSSLEPTAEAGLSQPEDGRPTNNPASSSTEKGPHDSEPAGTLHRYKRGPAAKKAKVAKRNALIDQAKSEGIVKEDEIFKYVQEKDATLLAKKKGAKDFISIKSMMKVYQRTKEARDNCNCPG